MYKIIACNIFNKEIENLMNKDSITKNVIFVEQGLHNTPTKMSENLQQLICDLEEDNDFLNTYEGIILLYGLCGNGTLGLKTKKVKLVIPRAHDCMTLFLGSKERYKNIIDNNKGVYWYNHAWIDQTPMPSKKRMEISKNDYYEYYDEDNAEYLYELEVQGLMQYRYGMLIKSPLVDNEPYKEFLLNEVCDEFNWQYKEEMGDVNLIENIINGIFNENEVLVLNPNEEIGMSLDLDILKGKVMKGENLKYSLSYEYI